MGNKIISVLEQLKQNGQLNDYLIDDDERKWTKLVYDILVNKFDYPFGRETMQQANQIYNDSVVAWKGQGKMTDLMGRAGFGEGKESNKRLIRLTESDLHRIVKESVQNILKETYDPCDELGHIRWRNRDYRNNSDDAQRVGKKRGEALANWNKRVKDSENKTVEESVNEVMYNGVSYHGTNPYDWVDIADERSQMGWKNRDDVSKYNQARFKAKDQGDLEGAEAASIMADKHRQQWNKNWGAAERNRNNAKQLGWQGQNDTRLGKAQEYYNMSQNAQNPQDRQKYNKMAQDTLGDVEGRANQALNRLRNTNR